MSLADDVRSYCSKHFVDPARSRGDKQVAIRAGDVHQALGYKNRLPLVCSALGAAVFESEYRVHRTAVEGPLNGSNTILRFDVCRSVGVCGSIVS